MYVFLDIDGVLNKKEQWNKMYSLDKECIKNFCTFINKLNSKEVHIVLTSSWKNGFVSTRNNNNTPQIKQLETMLEEFGLYIKAKTSIFKEGKRDREIEKFLSLHPTEQYIIIDDDRSEFGCITKNNYFTNAVNGFTKKDIKGCLKCI